MGHVYLTLDETTLGYHLEHAVLYLGYHIANLQLGEAGHHQMLLALGLKAELLGDCLVAVSLIGVGGYNFEYKLFDALLLNGLAAGAAFLFDLLHLVGSVVTVYGGG